MREMVCEGGVVRGGWCVREVGGQASISLVQAENMEGTNCFHCSFT